MSRIKRVFADSEEFKENFASIQRITPNVGVGVADVDTLALFTTRKVGTKNVVIDVVHLDVDDLRKLFEYAAKYTSLNNVKA